MKNKTWTIVAITILLLVIGMVSKEARAQESYDPYAIEGVVTDENGTLISNATVIATNLRTLDTIDAITEVDGSYTITFGGYEGVSCQDGDKIEVCVVYGDKEARNTTIVVVDGRYGCRVDLQLKPMVAVGTTGFEIPTTTIIYAGVASALVVPVIVFELWKWLKGAKEVVEVVRKKREK